MKIPANHGDGFEGQREAQSPINLSRRCYMLENSEVQSNVKVVAPAESAGMARRKLIRAGLAVAPVMLGLKSQSALATGTGGHCKTSVWSSLSAAKGCRSSHAAVHATSTCNNYTYWPTLSHTECGKKFHNHTTPCVPFDGSDFVGTPSVKDICRGKYYGSTGAAITTGNAEKDKFAKHCASMYLNNTISGSCPVDVVTVKAMWSACKSGSGTWTPASGGPGWTRKDCVEYFDYVCTGTKPSSWSTSCA